MAVTADSGVGLRALIDAVEAEGLSLVAAPYWEGVSVGGLISTGAHGSSWWGKGGAVHDHVIGISLVVPASGSQGYAKILRLGEKDPSFDAARVSLGLLGVISKVSSFCICFNSLPYRVQTQSLSVCNLEPIPPNITWPGSFY